MVNRTTHPAGTRGHADYGWLATYHTFSFGSYYNAHRMSFGKLRVLNDDVLQGGGGFGAHEHENMEIISIPIQGALEHSDSTGHTSIIRPNDVQVMSAGTGIMHAERNYSSHEPVSFLQLWILPEAQNLLPRYAQYSFDPRAWSNHFSLLVGPRQQQSRLWINQQAVVARASVEAGKTVCYTLQQSGHGIYIFVIEGEISVAEEILNKRDGMGVEGASQLACRGIKTSDVLLVEVPM
jgi:quercetin 2,3-dioxygenase